MDEPLLIAPDDAASWPEWRRDLAAWRSETRRSFDDSEYRDPRFAWAARCYSCAMVMVWDEEFMDARHGRYRVDEVVRDGIERFGGYDAVVLWQAYPRIGFDARNQFDYYRELPTGLDRAVRRFHDHGVRVFLDYNPWDTGTRREGRSDADGLRSVIDDLGADGLFLDTLDRAEPGFREKLSGVAFESEGALPIESVPSHHLSWAQWFDDGAAPGVLRNRWLERRHMMHMIRRWDKDHSGELHLAWMNGAGMLVWENVFGSWNGWSLQDRETLRAMLPIQRAMHRFFVEGEWTPLVPTTAKGVYATEWRLGDQRLWTLVNRLDWEVEAGIDTALPSGCAAYDLVAGRETARLSTTIPARGVGCLLASPSGLVDRRLLEAQGRRKPASDDAVTTILPVVPAKQVGAAKPGMVRLEGGRTEMRTSYRRRECGESGYAPLYNLAYPPLHQPVEEVRAVDLPPFAIDENEVTNAEYAVFVRQTGHRAAVSAGGQDDPVVGIDLDDARAYAKWAGKRLPTDAEWQFAAQQGRLLRADRPVWEWTESEGGDGHTRFCLLKGGSWYRADGSEWYADGGVRGPEFAAKFIRVTPDIDRCETIGFRCAITLP